MMWYKTFYCPGIWYHYLTWIQLGKNYKKIKKLQKRKYTMKPMKFKEEMKKLIQGKVQKRENIFMSFSYNWIHDLSSSILAKIELFLKLWFISLIITNFNFSSVFPFLWFLSSGQKSQVPSCNFVTNGSRNLWHIRLKGITTNLIVCSDKNYNT